jgi:hypothetical protein
VVGYGDGREFVWDVDPEVWQSHACRVAGRVLAREEWAQFLPDRGYRPACSAGG